MVSLAMAPSSVVCLVIATISEVCLAAAPSSMVCLAIAPFSSRPPATLAVRGRFLKGDLPYYGDCVSFNYFSSCFSWFHNQAVQRCGSGF